MATDTKLQVSPKDRANALEHLRKVRQESRERQGQEALERRETAARDSSVDQSPATDNLTPKAPNKASPSEAQDGDDLLDIRIALVLYGGVSLAIYENGVTRSFYDLIKKKGIFSLLLALRDAHAQVDVIAGTSAGGINGLLLAAALESGADFAASEDLWRDLGDLGALLRDVKDADAAQSLLKGETYYQDRLISAFQQFCTPPGSGKEYGKEMDVFITGTDLDGQERTNFDALGNLISDKEHRVVFQLQHRPGRKALGYVDKAKGDVVAAEQGTILGSIARITSSFPAAFPPFRLAHLDAQHGTHKDAVQLALQRTARAGIDRAPDRSFADGGLLDNKPFGPVLEAVFHRMPTGAFERRLFYVEPDPEPRPDPPNPAKHTPLSVAGASLSAIPSHETIWGDLRDLERHNAQVKWLRDLKTEWTHTIEDPSQRPLVAQALADSSTPWSKPYWRTRVESLARSLFAATDVTTPSAEDEIVNPAHKQLADTVRRRLSDWTPRPLESDEPRSTAAPVLNSFDADFQLRRSFHLLYDLCAKLREANPASRDQARSAMRLIGRIIKAQKIVRDIMLDLREAVLNFVDRLATHSAIEDEQRYGQHATFVFNLYRLFLDAAAAHWAPILPYCRWSTAAIRATDGDWKKFLHSTDLSAAAAAARDQAKQPAEFARQVLTRRGLSADAVETLATTEFSVDRTILDELEQALRHVLDAYCRDAGDLEKLPGMVDRFMEIDIVTYPLEFVGSMYELDEIRYVRISPQDAQTALSEGPAKSKVAGDELFHFSAFLRKDWRSNDILQGRLDGICQIVHALLAPTVDTLRQVQGRQAELTPLFDASNREKIAPGCLPESWAQLSSAWTCLGPVLAKIIPQIQHLKPNASFVPPPDLAAAWGAFCDHLICVGQEDAFQQNFPTILEDHYYQEMAFGAAPEDVPTGSIETINNSSEPSATMLKGAAARAAKDQLDATPIEKRLQCFRDMRLGGQAIGGRDGSVPPHISGEYVTHTYLLLWGMVRMSLGKFGKAVLDRTTVRLVLRHPPAFFNAIFFLMRRSYTTALASIATTAGLILGAAATAYYIGGPGGGWLCIGAIALLLLFMRIIAWTVPRLKRRPLALTLVPAIVLVAAGAAALIGTLVEHRLPDWWERIAAFAGGPNGPVGFLIGILASTVIFSIVGFAGRRRTP